MECRRRIMNKGSPEDTPVKSAVEDNATGGAPVSPPPRPPNGTNGKVDPIMALIAGAQPLTKVEQLMCISLC